MANKLQKKLGLVELVFFGIGAIIGTGIFIIPAIGAKIAGVASFWIWLELGLLTIFMSLCFAELASIYPHAGGPYKFVKEAFGNYVGFLTGWLGWIISWVTIASLALAVGHYTSFFVHLEAFTISMLAIGVLGFFTILNYYGIKWGVRAQFLLTSISILVLWTFITWGIYYIDISHFEPTAMITLPALFFASVFVIEPFIGWETITYFSEEAKNPKKDIPKAIVYSSVFVTVIYCAVIFVTLGVLNPLHLGTTYYPIAEAARTFLGGAGGIVVALGAIAVLLGCLNSWVISTARLPYALARDGFLPSFLNKIHKKHAVPHTSLILQFVFASIAVMLASFEEIIYVLVTLAMLMYLIIFLSIPVHRKRVKDIPYKLPLKGLVPMVASLLALFVLFQIAFIYFGIVILILAVGSLVYAQRVKFFKFNK